MLASYAQPGDGEDDQDAFGQGPSRAESDLMQMPKPKHIGSVSFTCCARRLSVLGVRQRGICTAKGWMCMQRKG
jgi:hypothetical protein